jgi:hypothetical protein
VLCALCLGRQTKVWLQHALSAVLLYGYMAINRAKVRLFKAGWHGKQNMGFQVKRKSMHASSTELHTKFTC